MENKLTENLCVPKQDDAFRLAFDKSETIYEETGSWSNDSMKYSINYSSILTKLIQETGRLCDNYASDMFITWKNVEDVLATYDAVSDNSILIVFGIRESGVDHDEYVISVFNDYMHISGYLENYYRAIYAVEIKRNNDDGIIMTLKDIRSQLSTVAYNRQNEKQFIEVQS